jgi:hypothetical protein
MAHFCKTDENNVLLLYCRAGKKMMAWKLNCTARTGDVYKQTSYNTVGGVHYTDGLPSDDQNKALRFNYAGIGYTYDVTRDAFIPPTPYPSWVLDEATCLVGSTYPNTLLMGQIMCGMSKPVTG